MAFISNLKEQFTNVGELKESVSLMSLGGERERGRREGKREIMMPVFS